MLRPSAFGTNSTTTCREGGGHAFSRARIHPPVTWTCVGLHILERKTRRVSALFLCARYFLAGRVPVVALSQSSTLSLADDDNDTLHTKRSHCAASRTSRTDCSYHLVQPSHSPAAARLRAPERRHVTDNRTFTAPSASRRLRARCSRPSRHPTTARRASARCGSNGTGLLQQPLSTAYEVHRRNSICKWIAFNDQ